MIVEQSTDNTEEKTTFKELWKKGSSLMNTLVLVALCLPFLYLLYLDILLDGRGMVGIADYIAFISYPLIFLFSTIFLGLLNKYVTWRKK